MRSQDAREGSTFLNRPDDAGFTVADSGMDAGDLAGIHAALFGGGDDEDGDEDDPEESVAERAGGHTGGMIALLPDADTAAALAVDGGLDADELHCTLAYLGDDVTGWDSVQRDDVVTLVRGLAARAPITGRVLGRTVFNETTKPHTVYLVGDAPGLGAVAAAVWDDLADRDGVPDQLEPYVAHITAGRGIDPADLVAEADLRFDRLAVVLAGDWTEVPLTEAAESTHEAVAGGAVEWTGWERDAPTSAHYADQLLGAMDQAFDAEQVARDWLTGEAESLAGAGVAELVPSPAAPVALKLPSAAQTRLAVRFVSMLPVEVQAVIVAVLVRLLVEAFLIGVIAARDALRSAGGAPPVQPPTDGGAAPADDDDGDPWWNAEITYGSWDVGDHEAAEKVLGDTGLGDGLRAMLADSDVALTGITDERMAEFARVLAQALADGDSVETLAARLRAFQADRVWARRTAITETARAVSAATVDRYLASGVERHEWLVAGADPTDQVRVCPRCEANSDQGPVEIGEPFESGAAFPPQHPNCRCALIPVIEWPEEADHGALWSQVGEAGDDGDVLGEAGDQLRDYWVTGKGAKRWTTWTQLYRLIKRHVPPERAKRIAAAWYRLRYGRTPNDKGKPGKGV